MADGVDGCKAIVCFMTQQYQDSKIVRELTYADTEDKIMVLVWLANSRKQSWMAGNYYCWTAMDKF